MKWTLSQTIVSLRSALSLSQFISKYNNIILSTHKIVWKKKKANGQGRTHKFLREGAQKAEAIKF